MSRDYQARHSKDDTQQGSGQTAPGRKKGRALSNALLVIGIALLVVAAVLIGPKLFDYVKADRIYAEVSDHATMTSDDTLDVDWASLRAVNPDIVAWVKIPDTAIDYPVVQATDNDYYLHHAFNRDTSSSGCPFLDAGNSSDLLDNNSFIYGHNMRNGSMFHDLSKFTDNDYFSSHPYVYIATPDGGSKRYRCVGSLLIHGDEQVCQLQFNSKADYQSYLAGLLDRCETMAPGVSASAVTRTVVLSTCSYQFDAARTLVICVEVDGNGAFVDYPMRSPASAAPSGTAAQPAT